jgi:hypothetical protein
MPLATFAECLGCCSRLMATCYSWEWEAVDVGVLPVLQPILPATTFMRFDSLIPSEILDYLSANSFAD